MNPLESLPPEVFARLWVGSSLRAVQSPDLHVCVVHTHHRHRQGTASSQAGTEHASHTRTLLSIPHSDSCPLDYTPLFLTYHRRQREKLTQFHASRPVPLLSRAASDVLQKRHEEARCPPPVTARAPLSGWTTASRYAPQNAHPDHRGTRARRTVASADRRTVPEREDGSAMGMVDQAVPESVAAVIAHLSVEPDPVASPATSHPHQQQQRLPPPPPSSPPISPHPRHMQYRVGRSGSTQLVPLSVPHNGSSDDGVTVVFEGSYTRSIVHAAPTSETPPVATETYSLPAALLGRPSATVSPPSPHVSPVLPVGAGTVSPDSTSMTGDVLPHTTSAAPAAEECDVGVAGADGEKAAREQLLAQLQRNLERQHQQEWTRARPASSNGDEEADWNGRPAPPMDPNRLMVVDRWHEQQPQQQQSSPAPPGSLRSPPSHARERQHGDHAEDVGAHAIALGSSGPANGVVRMHRRSTTGSPSPQIDDDSNGNSAVALRGWRSGLSHGQPPGHRYESADLPDSTSPSPAAAPVEPSGVRRRPPLGSSTSSSRGSRSAAPPALSHSTRKTPSPSSCAAWDASHRPSSSAAAVTTAVQVSVVGEKTCDFGLVEMEQSGGDETNWAAPPPTPLHPSASPSVTPADPKEDELSASTWFASSLAPTKNSDPSPVRCGAAGNDLPARRRTGGGTTDHETKSDEARRNSSSSASPSLGRSKAESQMAIAHIGDGDAATDAVSMDASYQPALVPSRAPTSLSGVSAEPTPVDWSSGHGRGDEDGGMRGGTVAPLNGNAPVVHLGDALCFSSDSRVTGAHGRPSGPERCRSFPDSPPPRKDEACRARLHDSVEWGDAFLSMSPPSPHSTAMRRAADVWERDGDGDVAASGARDENLRGCACTPQCVAGHLTLSVEKRTPPSPRGADEGVAGRHDDTAPTSAAPTSVSVRRRYLTTTAAASPGTFSTLSVFSTPAQGHLQALLQSSTWSCSCVEGSPSTGTARWHDSAEKVKGVGDEEAEDKVLSRSPLMAQGRDTVMISLTATPSDTERQRPLRRISGEDGVSSPPTPPERDLPSFPHSYRSAPYVRGQRTKKIIVDVGIPPDSESHEERPSVGEWPMQGRATELWYACSTRQAEGNEEGVMTLPNYSPSSSPSRFSLGSLNYHLAASMRRGTAAQTPRRAGVARAMGGWAETSLRDGEGEERHRRSAGSDVYGEAVAWRHSWAPQKRREAGSSHNARSPSHRILRGERTPSFRHFALARPSTSSGRHYGFGDGVGSLHSGSRSRSRGNGDDREEEEVPQRLTFGSALASLATASSVSRAWPASMRTSSAAEQPLPLPFTEPRALRDAVSGGEPSWDRDGHLQWTSTGHPGVYASTPRSSWRPVSPPEVSLARTPSGERAGRSSLEFRGAPQRRGRCDEMRESCVVWTHPLTSCSADDVDELSHRHVPLRISLGSSSKGTTACRPYAHRALSFSCLRSPSSPYERPSNGTDLEQSGNQVLPLDASADLTPPSPDVSAVRNGPCGGHDSRRSVGFVAQVPQPLLTKEGVTTASPPTLADELRSFAMTRLPSSSSSPPHRWVPPSVRGTFIASPTRQTGSVSSSTRTLTMAPPRPHSPRRERQSFLQAPRREDSGGRGGGLPPFAGWSEWQRRSVVETASALIASRVSDDDHHRPSPVSTADGKSSSLYRPRGCHERREVNVEPRQPSPCTPPSPSAAPPSAL